MAEHAQGRSLALGFIGGGRNSAIGQTHAAACQLDGRWHLAAGAFSRDAARNAATGAAWQVADDRVYANWRDLLLAERSRLDAVALLTPAPNHYEIIQALLHAGVPLICGQALVGNLSDARTLLAQVNPARHFVALAGGYNGYAMLREMRRQIADGRLGQLHRLHIELPQDEFARSAGSLDRAALGAHPKDEFIPRICLELGVQVHHLAYFLSGEEPEMVNAEFSSHLRHRDLVDNAALWLQYASGLTANLWISRTAIGQRDGLCIRAFGSEGSAQWSLAEADRLYVARVDGGRSIIDRDSASGGADLRRLPAGHSGGLIEACANQYRDIADALLTWREHRRHTHPFVFGIQHATNGLALLHAARLSSSRRRWERVQAPAPYREALGSSA